VAPAERAAAASRWTNDDDMAPSSGWTDVPCRRGRQPKGVNSFRKTSRWRSGRRTLGREGARRDARLGTRGLWGGDPLSDAVRRVQALWALRKMRAVVWACAQVVARPPWPSLRPTSDVLRLCRIEGGRQRPCLRHDAPGVPVAVPAIPVRQPQLADRPISYTALRTNRMRHEARAREPVNANACALSERAPARR
jgi:hypothetical protein